MGNSKNQDIIPESQKNSGSNSGKSRKQRKSPEQIIEEKSGKPISSKSGKSKKQVENSTEIIQENPEKPDSSKSGKSGKSGKQVKSPTEIIQENPEKSQKHNENSAKSTNSVVSRQSRKRQKNPSESEESKKEIEVENPGKSVKSAKSQKSRENSPNIEKSEKEEKSEISLGTKTLMNAKESSKVGNQRLQRAVKKKIVEEKENKVKLPQIDVKKRGKRGNSKKTSKEESCQDDVNITIEELVPPLKMVKNGKPTSERISDEIYSTPLVQPQKITKVAKKSAKPTKKSARIYELQDEMYQTPTRK